MAEAINPATESVRKVVFTGTKIVCPNCGAFQDEECLFLRPGLMHIDRFYGVKNKPMQEKQPAVEE